MLHAIDALKEEVQGVAIGDVCRKGIREIHTAGVQISEDDWVRDFVIGAESGKHFEPSGISREMSIGIACIHNQRC